MFDLNKFYVHARSRIIRSIIKTYIWHRDHKWQKISGKLQKLISFLVEWILDGLWGIVWGNLLYEVLCYAAYTLWDFGYAWDLAFTMLLLFLFIWNRKCVCHFCQYLLYGRFNLVRNNIFFCFLDYLLLFDEKLWAV